MKTEEDIRPISYIKAHAAEILSQVNRTKRPVYVTQNGEAKAVLLDSESFQNMREALGLLKLLSAGEADVRNNRLLSQDEVFNRINKKLKL